MSTGGKGVVRAGQRLGRPEGRKQEHSVEFLEHWKVVKYTLKKKIKCGPLRCCLQTCVYLQPTCSLYSTALVPPGEWRQGRGAMIALPLDNVLSRSILCGQLGSEVRGGGSGDRAQWKTRRSEGHFLPWEPSHSPELFAFPQLGVCFASSKVWLIALSI